MPLSESTVFLFPLKLPSTQLHYFISPYFLSRGLNLSRLFFIIQFSHLLRLLHTTSISRALGSASPLKKKAPPSTLKNLVKPKVTILLRGLLHSFMCVLICFHRTASFWLITRFTQTFLASAVKSRKKMRTSLMGRIVTFIIFSLTGSSRSRNTRQGHQLAMASAVPQPPPGLHETPKRSNIPVQHISTPYHPPPMSLHQAPGKPLSRYLKKFSCCSLIGRVCRRQLQRAGGGAGGT